MRDEKSTSRSRPDNNRLTAPLSTFINAQDLERLGAVMSTAKSVKKPSRKPRGTARSRAAEVPAIAHAMAEAETTPTTAERRLAALARGRKKLADARAEAKAQGVKHVSPKSKPVVEAEVPVRRGRPRTRGLFKPEMLPLVIKIVDLLQTKKVKKDAAIDLLNGVLAGATKVTIGGSRLDSIELFVRQNPGCLVKDIEAALDVAASDVSRLVTQKVLFALRSQAADRKAGILRLYSLKDPVGRLIAKSHSALASERSGVGGRKPNRGVELEDAIAEGMRKGYEKKSQGGS